MREIKSERRGYNLTKSESNGKTVSKEEECGEGEISEIERRVCQERIEGDKKVLKCRQGFSKERRNAKGFSLS